MSSGRLVRSSSSRCSSSLLLKSWATTCSRWTTSTATSVDTMVNAPTEANRTNATTQPTLRHIPKLPFIGSMWPAYSGIPKMETSSVFSFWPAVHRQYGDFYTLGMPGLGKGIFGTVYVIHDPVEMARIVRQEGIYPAGVVEFAWPVIHYSKEHGSVVMDMFGKGPGWKRIRTFINTDLLHPQAAARYGTAVLEGAVYLSSLVKSFHEGGGRLNDYLNMASFSMFSNLLLGHLPRGLTVSTSSDASTVHDGSDLEFCHAVAKGLRLNAAMMESAYDAILTTQLGYKTKGYREFEAAWHTVQTTARAKVEALYAKRQTNKLTEAERESYANQAFERHEASMITSSSTKTGDTSAKDLSMEEVKSVISGLLAAAVDTTGGLLSWKLLHLALSEPTQSAIYTELTSSMKRHDVTALIPDCLTPTESPMLHAAMREAHRLSNPVPIVPLKILQETAVVHGVTLPPRSVVMLDGYTTGIRPDIVGEDAMVFDPTRFLPATVEARKTTPSSVMDHPFFAGPFSQGARRCPGSRVANVEVTALMAQMILDWHMSVPGVQDWRDVPYEREAVTVVHLPDMKFTARAK